MRRLLIALFCFIPACAPSLKHHERLDRYLSAHQYEEAAQLVKENKKGYGERNAVLYDLDRGMLLHLSGKYEESNTFFEMAKTKIERLYTQSLVANVGALISNDNLLPYVGEDFEKVMVHLFSALNYAALSQWDEALVESRQVDALLNRLNDNHEKKNVYKKDAFARYLAGVLYEARDEVNDAFISYRKAYDVFKSYQKDYRTPFPERLGFDLLKTADALFLEEEFTTYKNKFPKAAARFPLTKRRKEGEVIVLAYAGRSPIKEDFFIATPIPNGEGGIYLLSVAMPKFVDRPSRVEHVEIILRKGETILTTKLDLLEDITAIAKKNLEDRVGRITAKAIARATTKYLATRAVRRKIAPQKGDPLGELIGMIGNVYSVATEQSDKRSWRTLPGQIYLGRLLLPGGHWDAEVRYTTGQDVLVETRHFPNLEIEPKKKRFLISHSSH